jgi:hypothetical protein
MPLRGTLAGDHEHAVLRMVRRRHRTVHLPMLREVQAVAPVLGQGHLRLA